MDAPMHLVTRSVQLAVMAAPSPSLDQAISASRGDRRSTVDTVPRAVPGRSRRGAPMAA